MNTQKQIANYIARQKGWIKANNLKEGDLVLVTNSHESYSKGWQGSWSPAKTNFINRILTFNFPPNWQILPITSICLKDFRFRLYWLFPYTVLRKIEIKIYGDIPEKGDIVYIRPMSIFYPIHAVESDTRITVKTSSTMLLTTSNWRYATREEIIQYYNKS